MSLLELKLQPAKIEQLKQVVELDQLCLGGLWTLDGYQRELKNPNSKFLVLSISSAIASHHKAQELENQNDSPSFSPSFPSSERDIIIGYGCFWAILEEAHITLLIVHPEYQGQGFGQLLLYALLEEAFKRKLERATLEVRPSNQVALSLYQKFGFTIAGRRKGYYQKTGEDALILWRGDLHKSHFVQNLKIWQNQIMERLAQNHWQLSE
jgi:ribosomal-protein-alanine N-acetyltransferase